MVIRPPLGDTRGPSEGSFVLVLLGRGRHKALFPSRAVQFTTPCEVIHAESRVSNAGYPATDSPVQR